MKKEPHKLMKSIQRNLIKRREEMGLTQAQLVEKSGISHSLVSTLERGMRDDIHLETLYNLSLGLECEVSYLLYGN